MRKLSAFFYTLIFLSSLYSCTITKRHYTSGYSIQWNKHVKPAILKLGEANKSEVPAAEQINPNESEIPQETIPAQSYDKVQVTSNGVTRDARLKSNVEPTLPSDTIKMTIAQNEMQTKSEQLITATKVHMVLTPALIFALPALFGVVSLIFLLGFLLISSIVLTTLVRRFKLKYRQFRNEESYKRLVKFNVFNQVMLILSIIMSAIVLGITALILIWTLS